MKDKLKVWARLFTYIKPLWLYVTIAIVFGSLGNILSTLIPTVGALAIVKKYKLLLLFVVLIIMTVVRALSRYIEQLCNHYVAFTVLARLRDKVFKALSKLAPAKLDSKDSGSLISLVTADIEILELFFAHTVSPIAIATIQTIVVFVLIVLISPVLAVVMLISHLLLSILIPCITTKMSKGIGEKQREKTAMINSTILDTFEGIKECIQYGHGEDRLAIVDEESNVLEEYNKRISKLSGRNQSMSGAFVYVSVLVFLCVSISILPMEKTLVATLLFFSSFGPALALSNLGSSLLLTFASAVRLFNLLDEKPEVEEIMDKEDVLLNSINVKNLTYSHDDTKLLEDISLEIKDKNIYGICGPSGSGKTTLLKLIMRYHNYTTGSIEYNGIEARNVNTKSIYENINYVMQDKYLFNDTIFGNISIAKPNATLEEVRKACKRASLDDFIMSLPNKYDTKIDHIKSSLSTGEAKRLDLARSFLCDSKFILLDEPTSNIDSMNEGIVLKSLYEVSKEKKMVIVTHMKSTLKIADEILELDRKSC